MYDFLPRDPNRSDSIYRSEPRIDSISLPVHWIQLEGRVSVNTNYAPLTSLAKCGGCAAKFAPDHLRGLIEIFGAGEVPGELMIGLETPDDAAVYRLNDQQALIFTTDFFPPLVDDPYLYGAIAAANAMSDVFAMGGRVVMALNIAALPEDMPPEVAKEIFRGGANKVREAGGLVVGGHTIRDAEPKYGMAVVGLAHPDHIATKGGARAGDRLLLTKPLGAGVTITGRRKGLVGSAQLDETTSWMTTLNDRASRALVTHGVRTITDVTGFGLVGHGLEMADAAGVKFVFAGESIPLQSGAMELANKEVRTSGDARNRRSSAGRVVFRPGTGLHLDVLLHDPQTSGGLLAAAAPPVAEALLARASCEGIPMWDIGTVAEGSGIEVI